MFRLTGEDFMSTLLKEKSRPRAVVVGAGIIGLTTALRLAEKGFDVTVLERGVQRDQLAVDLGANAEVSEVRVDPVGEVKRRRPGRHVLDLAAGCEDEHLVLDRASSGERLKGGRYLCTWCGRLKGDTRYRLVTAVSKNGLEWKIRGTIADPECALASGGDGPCESAVCRLKDGRLMCVFRLWSFVDYGQSFSHEIGRAHV